MKQMAIIAAAMMSAAAAAMSYPPYEIYTGATSGTPQLNYTKVCEPGRTGFVTVITEIKGGAVAVPESWAAQFPGYASKFGGDFTASLTKLTGKTDAAGNAMQVWQDYVAGTAPTDINDRFMAEIHVVNNVPVVSWSPVLSETEAAKRDYIIYGRTSLFSGDWTPVPSGQASNYNFFKVVVRMK